MSKYILHLFLLIFILWSCEGSLKEEMLESNELLIEKFLSSNNLSYTKTNGVYHAIQNKGFGYTVNSGDSIAFWYVGYTLNGTIFDTNVPEIAEELDINLTPRNLEPVKIVENSNSLIEGLQRGIKLCREGEQATILFGSDLGFGSNNMGPVPPWSPLAYDILIIYVKNVFIEQEQNIISNFVASNQGFVADSLTGAWKKYLTEIQNDDLPKASLGDTIYGYYKESVLNSDAIIETPAQGIEMVLSTNDFTEGLVYGFMMLKPGESLQLVVSSAMGYGFEDSEIVDPYTPLIYEFRLDSIK
jgi:FKBP-type peptidyl-prolyl cis-trans isomerase